MKMISRVSVIALSVLALNAAPPTPTPQKKAVIAFEEIAFGKKSSAAFAELIAKPLPIIVKFYLPGCGPCKSTEADFEMLAKKYQDQAMFVTLDVTKFDIADKYSIKTVPTFILFNKNKKIAQFKRDGLKKDGFIATIEKELKKLTIPQEKA